MPDELSSSGITRITDGPVGVTMASGQTSLAEYEGAARDNSIEMGEDEVDEYEDVVEAEPWLPERAWDELADFLGTWSEMEDFTSLDKMRDIVQKFRRIATYVHKPPKAKKSGWRSRKTNV
ncbi:hypothetical protein DVH05_007710 [Phytophthora capsici]|nr:hypothetical protein DVH05_007710 [Phytophthora capsici]